MLYQRTIIEWQFWLSKRIIFSLFGPNNFYTDSITHTVYALKQKIIIDFKMLYKIHTVHIYIIFISKLYVYIFMKKIDTHKKQVWINIIIYQTHAKEDRVSNIL